jgi:hypothetical protein
MLPWLSPLLNQRDVSILCIVKSKKDASGKLLIIHLLFQLVICVIRSIGTTGGMLPKMAESLQNGTDPSLLSKTRRPSEKHTALHAAISGPSDKHAGHQREWQLYNTEGEISCKVLKRLSHFYNGSQYDLACKTPRQKTAEQIAVFWALHSF